MSRGTVTTAFEVSGSAHMALSATELASLDQAWTSLARATTTLFEHLDGEVESVAASLYGRACEILAQVCRRAELAFSPFPGVLQIPGDMATWVSLDWLPKEAYFMWQSWQPSVAWARIRAYAEGNAQTFYEQTAVALGCALRLHPHQRMIFGSNGCVEKKIPVTPPPGYGTDCDADGYYLLSAESADRVRSLARGLYGLLTWRFDSIGAEAAYASLMDVVPGSGPSRYRSGTRIRPCSGLTLTLRKGRFLCEIDPSVLGHLMTYIKLYVPQFRDSPYQG